MKTSGGRNRRKRSPGLTVVGLMSGTSADGISAAVVRIGPDGIRLRRLHQIDFPPEMRGWIHDLGSAEPEELSRANVVLGEAFAAAASSAGRADLIASHGQTVLHRPDGRPPHTLQLGEPSIIAERTGVTTVADFRPRDMAAGGEGAPLVPFFDHHVFRRLAPVAIVNIGGISNLTRVSRTGANCRAWDIGPGNCMIDEAVRIATRGRLTYDAGGALARKGRLDPALLRRLQAHAFLARRPPRSACRSDFVPDFLRRTAGRLLNRDPLRVIATLTWFSAYEISRHIRGASRVVVSGGGVFNDTLMAHLTDACHPVPVESIEAHGWHPLAKEAAAFALFGARTLAGRTCTLPRATGARRAVPAGKIVPGRNYRALLRRMT